MRAAGRVQADCQLPVGIQGVGFVTFTLLLSLQFGREQDWQRDRSQSASAVARKAASVCKTASGEACTRMSLTATLFHSGSHLLFPKMEVNNTTTTTHTKTTTTTKSFLFYFLVNVDCQNGSGTPISCSNYFFKKPSVVKKYHLGDSKDISKKEWI